MKVHVFECRCECFWQGYKETIAESRLNQVCEIQMDGQTERMSINYLRAIFVQQTSFFSPSAQLWAARDVLRWWAHLKRVMEMMLRAVFLHTRATTRAVDKRRWWSCVFAVCFTVWWVLMEWVREVKFILGYCFCCDSFLALISHSVSKEHLDTWTALRNVWIWWKYNRPKAAQDRRQGKMIGLFPH